MLTSTPFKNLLMQKSKQLKTTEPQPPTKKLCEHCWNRNMCLKEGKKQIWISKPLHVTEQDTTPCHTRKQKFCDDKSGINWIQCQKCDAWFHDACQGLPDRGQQYSECIECDDLHRVTDKNKQNYFCYNYVKLPPNLTILDTKMTNGLELYEVHSFSTSPNSCKCTTVLNADVPNC